MSIITVDLLIDGDLHTFVDLDVPDEDAEVYADAIANGVMDEYPDNIVEEEENGDGED
jgi:hypothetical protein